MQIRERKISILESQKVITPMYRVLSNHEQSGIYGNRYKYYSKTIKHHIYFLVKRLFKQIDANYDININSHKDRYLMDKINEIINILETEDMPFKISSKYLWVDSNALVLIDEQSYSNQSYHKENAIEKSDYWVYGGGYGLKNLWQYLFDLLTFCESEQILCQKFILEFFYELRSILNCYGVKELRNAKLQAGKMLIGKNQSIQVNPYIEEDQTVQIISILDTICKAGLIKSNTSLAKTSEQTISLFVQAYQKNRQLILTQIKKH